jgi:carbamoyl-phosphate synthase large subunit
VQRRLPKTILANIRGSDPTLAVLIQERLRGQECGLDVINDLNGRYVTTFGRVKLAMRAGETDRAVTIKSGELERLGRALGTQLGHVGNLDCDVFLSDGRGYVLEMNPRFGGGYPFSHGAGANLPAALLAWADGQIPDPSWLEMRPDVAAAKCDRLVIVAADRRSGSGLRTTPGRDGNAGATLHQRFPHLPIRP